MLELLYRLKFSKGVWGGVFAIILGGYSLYTGVEFSCTDQQQLLSLFTAFAGALSAYGRIDKERRSPDT